MNGVRRQKSNEEVRTAFGTHTLISTLRKRRLDWLRNIVRFPEENIQLWAAVFVKLKHVQGIDMEWNLWVLQWEHVLLDLASKIGSTESFPLLHSSGEKQKYCISEHVTWFVSSEVGAKIVCTRREAPQDNVEVEPEMRCDHLMPDGSACQFAGSRGAIGGL